MQHLRASLATLCALILAGAGMPASAQSTTGTGTPRTGAKRTSAKKTTVKPAPKAATTAGASGTTAHTAHGALATSPAPATEVRVNEFMSYDPATRKVKLLIDAGLATEPAPKMGPFNFNGGSVGDQTITIPTGWTVDYHFVNHDAVPHSFIVIADVQPLPNAPETPAIPRAYSDRLTEGLFTNGTSDGSFRASKPGKFLLYCGVPGHGPSGMYINFIVSDGATVPAYQKA